jgi:antitoxin component of MazEF toxin-antitoxin module
VFDTDRKGAPKEEVVIVLKLCRIGKSVEMIVPREILEALEVTPGDTVYLNVSRRGYQLTSQIAMARKISRGRASALRKIAQ